MNRFDSRGFLVSLCITSRIPPLIAASIIVGFYSQLLALCRLTATARRCNTRGFRNRQRATQNALFLCTR